jgi:heterodisulfide reductase subunit A2
VSERIGVYVCHCGSNIAGVVNVVEVAQWAEKLPGVVISRDNKFMCSSPGQELIERDIKEFGLTRVVVAACSPVLHEPTFRGVCQRAGLNPYLFEMASIREQVSWVTTDKKLATQKAKALVSASVRRVAYQEALDPIVVKIHPDVLVVGGGVAGISAALGIAESGNSRVYLVEREPSIGGHMAQFDKTFPTLDCAACILAPKMTDTGQNPNITLLTCSEVEKVEGSVGNFTVTIRKKARKVIEDLCTGCLVCQEKCPKKVVDDVYEVGMNTRKAIYVPFPQAVPKYPVMDVENCTYFLKGTCKACEKFCPTNAIDFKQEDTILQVQVGNIVLATGYELFDARRIPEYGYGRLPNVFTNLEFERMNNASGPTEGRILKKDGTLPKAVGIIHCVGSRDKNYNTHCSAICCMQSLKFAHLVKEKTGAAVYNFYIDVRANAKSYEEFYNRVLEEGTLFVRGKVGEITDQARSPDEEGRLIIQVYDTLAGIQRRIPVDMVLLSCGIEPRKDSKEIGKRFGISCGVDGWLIERHPKIDPISTMTEGVYIAGCATGPKDIPAAINQGIAAASRIMARVSRGELTLEPIRATVNPDTCSGCRICNDLCPFNAISFLADQGISEINKALCQGCGTCVASCPAGAISGTGFSNDQVLAQIEGILAIDFYGMDVHH